MNLEKLIKYSVPFFVLAIVSRAVDDISFIYYAVPVMCVFFIVLLLISSKFNSLPRIYFGVKSQRACPELVSGSKVKGQKDRTESEYPESEIGHQESGIQHPRLHCITTRQAVSGIKHLPSTIFSTRGGFRPAYRTGRFAQHLPSSLFPLPFLLFLLPGLWFLLTSLWSSYPEISALRALYFILISTGCMSAGFLWLRYSGKGIFDFLLPANIFIVLLCLFSIITNIPSDSWTAGHGKGFIGFFGHQNLLASALLFTLPAVFDKIKDKSQKIKERKVFFFLLLSLNLLLLTLTYSRSAILSFLFGVIVFLILNKSWKIISYSLVAASFITLIIYSTPPLNQFADKIFKKDFPEVYSSRFWMWEPSYKAALEGGLFGLGYGISHPDIRSGKSSDRFEEGRLIREKGNSVLALIEEAGIIGMLLFVIPFFLLLIKRGDARYLIQDENYKSGIRNLPAGRQGLGSGINYPASSILIASFAAFILHSQFEAWWVGVGSVQLPLFFIYVGLIAKGSMSQDIK